MQLVLIQTILRFKITITTFLLHRFNLMRLLRLKKQIVCSKKKITGLAYFRLLYIDIIHLLVCVLIIILCIRCLEIDIEVAKWINSKIFYNFMFFHNRPLSYLLSLHQKTSKMMKNHNKIVSHLNETKKNSPHTNIAQFNVRLCFQSNLRNGAGIAVE